MMAGSEDGYVHGDRRAGACSSVFDSAVKVLGAGVL